MGPPVSDFVPRVGLQPFSSLLSLTLNDGHPPESRAPGSPWAVQNRIWLQEKSTTFLLDIFLLFFSQGLLPWNPCRKCHRVIILGVIHALQFMHSACFYRNRGINSYQCLALLYPRHCANEPLTYIISFISHDTPMR